LEPIFRRATRADLPSLVRMLSVDAIRERAEVVGDTLDPAYVAAFEEIDRDPNQLLLAAELDARVVGTLQLTFIRHLMYQGGLIAQIEAVRIDESLRGRGFGAKMMQHAIDEARRRGAARVQLTTNKQREAAHRFYLRLGFIASHEGMKLYLG
jgi:GNAT superfamily N-acetyltransferase